MYKYSHQQSCNHYDLSSLCSNLFFPCTEKKKCWMDVDCVIHIFIMIYFKNKNSLYIFNTF